MQILLDLDGVLADFHAGVRRWKGLDLQGNYPKLGNYDIFDAYDIKQSDFWPTLDAKFWMELPIYPNAEELIIALIKVVGEKNVCLLTSNANADAAYGKVLWIKNHLPFFYSKRQYLVGPAKHFCTNKNERILIDDWDVQCEKFRANGGFAIMYPQCWNQLYPLMENQIGYVMEQLRGRKIDNTGAGKSDACEPAQAG